MFFLDFERGKPNFLHLSGRAATLGCVPVEFSKDEQKSWSSAFRYRQEGHGRRLSGLTAGYLITLSEVR